MDRTRADCNGEIEPRDQIIVNIVASRSVLARVWGRIVADAEQIVSRIAASDDHVFEYPVARRSASPNEDPEINGREIVVFDQN